tara:strand:+ start:13 stop:702 length:690 start_codon:yes stop_codon:yes gene_type:complete
MTHNELASTIRNRVADGLSGNIADQAFSVEQLMAEIDLTRADIINKREQTAKLDSKYLMQKIDIIPIVCKPMSEDCIYQEPGGDIPSINVPKIMPTFGDDAIEYLGTVNMQERFSVYYHPDDIQHHKVRVRTAHRPFAWVDLAPNKEDMMTIWFFNFGKFNPLKFMKIRAIFEHPTRVGTLDPSIFDAEYPAPLHVQNTIVDTLTEKYVRYYRQLNIPSLPNQQTDQTT